jgi:hypothetical protein
MSQLGCVIQVLGQAIFSSLEFYAKKFVEFGVSKASSSNFEFGAEFVSKKVKREYSSKNLRSALKASRLFTALDFFGDLPSTMPAQDSDKVGDMVPKNSR